MGVLGSASQLSVKQLFTGDELIRANIEVSIIDSCVLLNVCTRIWACHSRTTFEVVFVVSNAVLISF